MQNHTGPFSKKPVKPLDGPFDNAPIPSDTPAPSASSGTAVLAPPGTVHRISPRLSRVLLTLMLVAICLGLGFDFWAGRMDLMGESGLTSHLVFGIGIALTDASFKWNGGLKVFVRGKHAFTVDQVDTAKLDGGWLSTARAMQAGAWTE